MALPANQPDPVTPQPLVTFRALAIGTTIAILATIGGAWGRFIVETTRLDQNHMSMAAVFPLLLITLFFAGPFRFSRGELATIFCMPLVTTTMPTYFVGRLIANITVPYYMASPENQWGTYYEPLPSYSVIPGGQALTWYFEGLPQGLSIPWDVWIVPMFWWFTAVAAFYGCCLFAMVMLRKQWVRNERIDYPLMQLPLAILEEEQSDGFFRMSMMNQPIFWLGFGLPAAIIAWNIVSYFEPTFPKIPYRGVDVSFGPHFQPMRTYLYPIIIGFGYFIRVDILVGLWLFNVLTNIEVGLLNTFGFKTEFVATHSTGPLPIGSQSMGAYVAIVAVGLWMARFHLRDVFRKAVFRDPSVDDSEEIVSYRVAVYGFAICGLYMAAWHWATGMEWDFLLVYLLGVFILYIAMTRVIAEAGVISLRTPLNPQPFAMVIKGTAGLTRETLVSTSLSYCLHSDIKTTIMPACAHSVMLFDTLEGNRRAMIWPIVIAMGAGLIATIAYTIYMGYTYGMANIPFMSVGGEHVWNDLVKKSTTPRSPPWKAILFMGIGAAITLALMATRYRFPGWPLHPIGFAAGPIYPVRDLAVSFFVAWLAKGSILKLGGIQGFRSARPFFVGMIVGHFVGASISFIIDVIWFYGDGHNVPFSDW